MEHTTVRISASKSLSQNGDGWAEQAGLIAPSAGLAPGAGASGCCGVDFADVVSGGCEVQFASGG
ncbi:hypothetical protein, partial [Micromonospora sp. NPDC005206]|uniref:hypothetical protein n=1 Tax=Micromonospora sp. NPDC005206 TaxID=3157022 RepID=UPI0033BE540A